MFKVTFNSSTSSRPGRSFPDATVRYWLLLHLLLGPGAASARSLGLLHSSSGRARQKNNEGQERKDNTKDVLPITQVCELTLLYSEKDIIPLRTVLFFLVYHRYCPSSSRQHSLRRHDHCLCLCSVNMLKYIPWD